jgi:adenosylcobinamide-GDP ribazoletransferase
VSGARTAWIFLTRVPAGDDPSPDIGRAVPWFPVVGAVVGAAVGLVFVGARELLPPLASAAATISAGALVTGAFHHDGLADIADAFGGGWDRAQRLQILKDPRHGTYGVMALVCLVVTQVAALAALGPAQGFATLVAAHTLGRAGAIALLAGAPAASGRGLGAEYAATATRRGVLVGIGVSAFFAALALGAWVAVALAAVACTSIVAGVLAHRKIGGISGDVLGAAEQLGETATLLVATGLVRHDVAFPWWR